MKKNKNGSDDPTPIVANSQNTTLEASPNSVKQKKKGGELIEAHYYSFATINYLDLNVQLLHDFSFLIQ